MAVKHSEKPGRAGALARMERYGNPGTPEGRRKGGLASLKSRQQNDTGRFVTLKKITHPDLSEKLAEFLGVMMGDGHLGEYQLSIATNSETDLQHAKFIAQMIHELFAVSSTLQFRKDRKCVVVVASSRALTDHVQTLGMPRGNKIAHKMAMPAWILQNENYRKAFLRGLFDTDGSIFSDKHIIKDTVYYSLGWTITSCADRLRTDVYNTLKDLGFSPTCSAPKVSIFLRRRDEIARYFDEIGTHNDKHQHRYMSFAAQTKRRVRIVV